MGQSGVAFPALTRLEHAPFIALICKRLPVLYHLSQGNTSIVV